MTDRELLENAAKAAGYKWRWFGEDFCTERDERTGLHMPWNPRTDDGDAFRLAIKLEMKLFPGEAYPFDNKSQDWPHFSGVAVDEDEEPDTCAATRLAIIRAAAAIGSKQ